MKYNLRLILLLVILLNSFSSVLISQIYPIEFLKDGIVFPRMNTSERDNVVAIQGQCIYNLDTDYIECYDGTNWISNNSPSNSNPTLGLSGNMICPNIIDLTGGAIDLTAFNSDTIAISDGSYNSNNGRVKLMHHYYGQGHLFEFAQLHGENSGDAFGTALASSNNGEHIVIGAPSANGGLGSVYFGHNSNLATLSSYQKIICPSGNLESEFGASIDIDGDWAVIGAQGENKAYIFYFNGTSWVLNWTLNSPVGDSDFGFYVAIDNGRVAVAGFNSTEEVFIYTNSAGSWNLNQVISAPSSCTALPLCFFGIALDLSGLNLIITSSDAVFGYVEDSNGNFNLNQTIELSPFGVSEAQGKQYVSVNGNTLAAKLSDHNIHLFNFQNGNWNYTGCTGVNGNTVEVKNDETMVLLNNVIDNNLHVIK